MSAKKVILDNIIDCVDGFRLPAYNNINIKIRGLIEPTYNLRKEYIIQWNVHLITKRKLRDK